MVRKKVKFGSTVYPENHVGFDGLRLRYSYEVINHMEACVFAPGVHTGTDYGSTLL
jgi:hypothetical protein